MSDEKIEGAAPSNPTNKKKPTPELIRKRRESKKRFALRAYERIANVSAVCQLAKINRDTFYEWIKVDPHFKARVEEVRESLIDNAETRLMSFIKEGNIAATIFFLKCQGKSRGYIERQEFTGAGGSPLIPNEVKHGIELAKGIVADPEAAALANTLLERLSLGKSAADGEEQSGGDGVVRH